MIDDFKVDPTFGPGSMDIYLNPQGDCPSTRYDIANGYVERIKLSRGDKIAVFVAHELSREEHDRLLSCVKDWAGVYVPVAIFERGMRLGVVSEGDNAIRATDT